MLKLSIFFVVVFLLVGGSFEETYTVDTVFGSEGHHNLGHRQVTPVPVPVPSTVFELVSGSATFKINNAGTTPAPYFTLNDDPYYVLGALNCSAGQSPIFTLSNSSWACGQFAGYGVSSGTVGSLSCLNGDFIFFNGAIYSCQEDKDYLSKRVDKTQCLDRDIVGELGGLHCALDLDLAFGQCPPGAVLSWQNGWVCRTIPDANTLGGLVCATGQVAKWNGTNWVCGADLDTTAAIICGEGQILKYNAPGNNYTCASDSNTVATLGCPIGSVLVKNSTTACYPMPQPNNPPVILIDGQTVPSASVATNMATFFGTYLKRAPGFAPLQFVGGFSVVAASFSLNKDPRTFGVRPDTGFTFALQLKDGTSGNLLATITLPANATSVYTSLSLNFPLDTSKLSPVYNYKGLSNVVGLTVTSTLVLRVKNY